MGIIDVTNDKYKLDALEYLLKSEKYKNANFLSTINECLLKQSNYKLFLSYKNNCINGALGYKLVFNSSYNFFAELYVPSKDIEYVAYKLIKLLPFGCKGYIKITNADLQKYFELKFKAELDHTDVYYAVNVQNFSPIQYNNIKKIEYRDLCLFENVDSWAKYSITNNRNEVNNVYAIIKNNEVITSAIIGPIFINENFNLRISGIAALLTEKKYRNMGYGKQLVSYLTEVGLKANDYMLYYTTPDNAISRKLAKSLGYQYIFTSKNYYIYL